MTRIPGYLLYLSLEGEGWDEGEILCKSSCGHAAQVEKLHERRGKTKTLRSVFI